MDEILFLVTKNIRKSALSVYEAFRNEIGDDYCKKDKEYTVSFGINKKKSIFFKLNDEYMAKLCIAISNGYFYDSREDKCTHSIFFYDAGSAYEIHIQHPSTPGSHLLKLNKDRTIRYG